MFKTGLCSISFRGYTPEEILKACNEARIEFIEWGSDVHVPFDDKENLKKIVELQNKYGIKASSYGTYFRLGETDLKLLPDYIAVAKTLGTNVLRLWCGNKSSKDYTLKEKELFFEECKKAARIAEEHGVYLCMECHVYTLTDNVNSAMEVIAAVNSPHFKMYWQPNQFESKEYNLNYAKTVAQNTKNIHVFNWKEHERFPLILAKETWREYLRLFDKSQILMLEFMPDDKLETLKTEADSLREIIK